MADGTLAGSVIDIRDNRPIAKATIEAKEEGGGDQKTTTGDDGKFSMQVPAGTYDMTVTTNGYAEGIYPGILVTDDVTTELPLALSPADSYE